MSNTFKKILVLFFFLMGSFGYYFYQIFFSPNIDTQKGEIVFYVPSNVTFDQISSELNHQRIISDVISFRFISKLSGYMENVKSGKYILRGGMNNIDIVRALRSGQKSVNVTFNNLRLKEQLPEKLTANLECKSDEFEKLLNDNEFLKKYELDSLTVACIFIPNTYQFFWNTSAEKLFVRMYNEYTKFWTKDRILKAEKLNLSKLEVSILGSIVEAEQKRFADERPTIAGVYLNRLKNNRLLQADPTVVFAVGDFSIKRLKRGHLDVDSPYNTYKYLGLPPGPINIPSIASIDAVLNYKEHDYLYFCARGDGSGYHDFSKTFAEHKNKALQYRRALNKAGVH